jgi:hypothetical protein
MVLGWPALRCRCANAPPYTTHGCGLPERFRPRRPATCHPTARRMTQVVPAECRTPATAFPTGPGVTPDCSRRATEPFQGNRHRRQHDTHQDESCGGESEKQPAVESREHRGSAEPQTDCGQSTEE